MAVSNAFGRVQGTVYDIEDQPYTVTDANGITVSHTYDNLGRILSRTYPDSGVESFGYTLTIAGPTSYTNQIGNVLLYAYDAAGRKTNEVHVGLETNRFTYSPASDLLSLADGKNQMTWWGYDTEGRVSSKTNANNVKILAYLYDANGRLTNRCSKAKGNTKYTHDAVGNLTKADYPVSTDIQLAYDALYLVTNMIDAAGTTRYTYYLGGQLNTEDGPWASDMVTYTYNNARLREGLTLQQPSGSWTQSYLYDTAKRLQSQQK
jgi:YD repeat-containing protein